MTDGVYKISNKQITKSLLKDMELELSEEKNLTHFVLYRNGMLMDESLETLCRILSRKELHSLYIWYNQLSDTACLFIGKYLLQLTSLDLSRNEISCNGAAVLASAFSCKSSNLQSLDLGHNQIQDKGCLCLFPSLLFKLNRLNLSFNKIGQQSAKFIIDYMMNKKVLTEIDLSGNTLIEPKDILLIKAQTTFIQEQRRRAAASLIPFSRLIYRVRLPLPPELVDKIIDTQIKPFFNQRDSKSLKFCLFNPCFLGWIKSSNRFSTEELLRLSSQLMKEQSKFQDLYKLNQKRKSIRKDFNAALLEYNKIVLIGRRWAIAKNVIILLFPFLYPILISFKLLFKNFSQVM